MSTQSPMPKGASSPDLADKDAASKAIDEAIDETGNAVKDTAEQLKSGAEEILESTKAAADTTAERVSAAVDRASGTLRSAADSLRDGSIQERTFGQLAASLADASDAIQNKDLGQLSRDVSNYARQHPAVFIGGAALLGFAVARMMHNSGDKS